jgi:hypothetical protein
MHYEKDEALAEFLGVDVDEIAEFDERIGWCLSYGNERYIVVNEKERDEVARENLESYIDECVLYQFPDYLRHYFDEERFIRDAIEADGYGHYISTYGGEEHKFGGYYIYRVD